MKTISIKNEEIKQKSCSFCGQVKLTFQICVGCKDELLNFQTENAVTLTHNDLKPFMRTLYWSCNLFLGFLENFDTTFRLQPEPYVVLKNSLMKLTSYYQPTKSRKFDSRLIEWVKLINEQLVTLKRGEFQNKQDRSLFHVFSVIFMHNLTTINLLSKVL